MDHQTNSASSILCGQISLDESISCSSTVSTGSFCDSDDERSCNSSSSSVSFGSITVREYPITIGDSPACTRGVPLALGWDHSSEEEIDIDQYEEKRPKRREREEMILPADVRISMLIENNYPMRMIVNTIRERHDEARKNKKISSNKLQRSLKSLKQKISRK